MEILQQFAADAASLKGTIIFAEGDEDRTLQAAVNLANDKICTVVVTAPSKTAIEAVARKNGLDISSLTIVEPSVKELDPSVLKTYIDRQVLKGVSENDARALVLDPLVFSALYVRSGKAGGCVAGARSSTPDVLRAAIHGIGAAPGTKFVSSYFLMVPPANHPVIKKPILYSDCGVNPDPSSMGLRDIAVASVRSFRSLFPGEPPRVAFLSFSTKGSAEHKMLAKIREAVTTTQEFFAGDKTVAIDGELQFDAAVIPGVASRKAPKSPIQGNANIFIFPDLNAGNICYKVTERLGGFTAIGPLIQGLARPMNDLSRGCSVSDIYYAAVIALLQTRSV